MAAPSGNRSGGEEGVLQKAAATAAKRLRRMISNRESARRSRMRKQKRLDDLAAQASRLGRENGRLLAAVKAAKRRCGAVEAENCVLRAQAMELGRRLRALDEIVLRFLDLSFGSGQADHNTLCDPWSLMHMMNQQPATAAAGNSVFYC